MSLTPRTRPDCRAIDLSRFRQLVAGQDDSAFPPIDVGYNTAQVKPRIVESWAKSRSRSKARERRCISGEVRGAEKVRHYRCPGIGLAGGGGI
jgi:hypothetical protein